ncbi:hypothetical protein [Methanosphaera sp. WGK6]|uniref:hypothetical protein n=1 Tax=Methanosphaera sp. WGK6 TaxID=1561964 RepID=UPI00084CC9C0|nr:hypothetical protein [Methanosphaera sp. WGK6]OED30382.1 hypothetical protein NL43_03140 [Methanosphaera sp. WGK6]
MSYYTSMMFILIGLAVIMYLFFNPDLFLWVDSKISVNMFNEEVSNDDGNVYAYLTYEGDVIKGCIEFNLFILIAVVIPYFLGFKLDEMIFTVGIMFMSAIIYALLPLYLRRDIFDLKHDSYSERIFMKDKKYCINTFYFTSVLLGFYPTGQGILTIITSGYISTVLLYGLLIQTIPFFPDVLDKIIPIDLKEAEDPAISIIFFAFSLVFGLYSGILVHALPQNILSIIFGL